MEEGRVYRLQLALDLTDIGDDHLETLKKYGKMKEGITRDILISPMQSLHQLHYIIQKVFGWQNSHLHKFELFDEDMKSLVKDSFKQYCMLCGIYFRFFYDDEMGMEDIYWDDNYEEGQSFKSWLKTKYTGIRPYEGSLEHYIVAQNSLAGYIERMKDESGMLKVHPTFDEWMKGIQEDKLISLDEVSYEVMFDNFECRLGELLERISIGELLTLHGNLNDAMKDIVANMNERAKSLKTDCQKLLEMKQLEYDIEEKEEKFRKYRRRKNADPRKISLNGEILSKMIEKYEREMEDLYSRTEANAIPFTNKILYNYDYGDGWEVTITLVDEYVLGSEGNGISGFYNGDTLVDEELGKALWHVMRDIVPVCVEADGLPVFDDVGGVGGYCEFLKRINTKKKPKVLKEPMTIRRNDILTKDRVVFTFSGKGPDIKGLELEKMILKGTVPEYVTERMVDYFMELPHDADLEGLEEIDGLKVVDDEDYDEDDYYEDISDDPEESREWARSLGWTGRASKPERML